jgi:nucleolar pre-ribosomal-associated protein 1
MEEVFDGPLDAGSLQKESLGRESSGLPHRANAVFVETSVPTLQSWAACVEKLWQVAMALQEQIPTWDRLSARMVLWRAIAGDEASEISEWVRRETIKMLQG